MYTKKVTVSARCGVTGDTFNPTVCWIRVSRGALAGFSSIDGGGRQGFMLSVHMRLHVRYLDWKVTYFTYRGHYGV